jgi:hypothetical protein
MSSLSVFNLSEDDIKVDYTLLDFDASVHVFNDRQRFSRFQLVEKNQMLKCDDDLIAIQE